MIDVHPAPHAAHSWREFLIHIATIAIGLLLALVLEQTVEHFHHLHQRHRLEQALHDEALLNRRIVAFNRESIDAVRSNIHLNMTNLDRGGKDFSPVPPTHDTFLPVVDSAWVVARSNGGLALLTDALAESYWKVEVLAEATDNSLRSLADARKKVDSLAHLHANPAELTTDERAALLRAYSEEDQELGNLNYIVMSYGYMNDAVLAGRVPTIDDLANKTRDARQTEAQPAHP